MILQDTIDALLHGLSITYGLDWITMFFGILGAYFITKKDKRGILLNILSCCSSFVLAIICHQYGFIIYNIIFMIIMGRAYTNWTAETRQQQTS